MLERNPPRAAAGQHHVEQGWVGRVARAGAGEGQQPVVGTTALQLAALLCRCVGHVTRTAALAAPHRPAPRRYTRRPLRGCGSLSHGVVLSGDIAIPGDTTRVYLQYLPATGITACRYNKKYKVCTHVRSGVGSYPRQHSDHKVCIRSVRVVMRTRDAAAVTV